MQNNKILSALKAAFPHTIPILAGFLFLGTAYGIYMNISGFSFWYPFAMAVLIFGGSLEFITVTMLLSPFAPLQALLITFMVQARHIFYGISMLEKFKGLGLKKIYLIYSMCDETFAINYSAVVPKNIDKGWFYFWISLLNQFYWVFGATLGGILGSLITFNTKGLDFVLTAMFTVIFVDQLLKEKKHYTSIIGLFSAVACLLVFGKNSFMIPTMICIILLLTAFRKPIEKYGELQ